MKISKRIDSTEVKYLFEQISNNISNAKLWEKAYNIFYNRIESRYFRPINLIILHDTNKGEGFAIMTILCSLIEFLETIRSGLVYKNGCKKDEKKNFMYGDSANKFKSFLSNQIPFKEFFNKGCTDYPNEEKIKTLCDAFYSFVRCGLLHEAQTKEDWLIRTDNTSHLFEIRKINNKLKKVIDRNLFKQGIEEYLFRYKYELFEDDGKKENGLKKSFLRKMRTISQI